MSGKYDNVATRTLAVIERKGGTVTFLADTWKGGTLANDVTGKAVQDIDDPERFRAVGLVISNPVTLLIAAKDLTITPAPGMSFGWNSRVFVVKDVESIDPAGDGAVLHTVIGGA